MVPVRSKVPAVGLSRATRVSEELIYFIPIYLVCLDHLVGQIPQRTLKGKYDQKKKKNYESGFIFYRKHLLRFFLQLTAAQYFNHLKLNALGDFVTQQLLFLLMPILVGTCVDDSNFKSVT